MADLRWIPAECRFDYLSEDDSLEYARVRNSADERDKVIKHLLEKLAAGSRSVHVNSRY